MKRILMLAFAAALSMSVSACQDSTSPSAVLSGTYTLRTIDGETPPVAVDANTDLVGGYIHIDRNGTFTDVITYRDISSGFTSDDTIDGTWALSGNTIEFIDSFDPNNPYYATVSNGQIVFDGYLSGYELVYVK